MLASGMAIVVLIVLLATSALAEEPSVGQLFQVAVQEQQAGKYADAIRDYRTILQREPNMVEARVNLGVLLADSGHYDDAIAMYKSALPLMASTKAVLMNIARAYYMKHDLGATRSQLEQVHQMYPQDQEVAVRLANVCLESKMPAEAVAILQPLEAAKSHDMDFQYLYGSALIANGHPEQGVPRIEAVAAKTQRADAYLLAGNTHMQYGHPYEARGNLEEAQRLNPQLPNIDTLVGVVRETTGDDRGAEEALRQALRKFPDDFQANLHLGTIYYRRRALDDAKKYLERALQLQPSDAKTIYMIGMLKSVIGDDQLAVDYLERASKQLPEWAAPHLELAKLYYRLHRNQDGLRERKLAAEIAARQQAQPNSSSAP